MSKFRRTARFNFDPPPRNSDELPHYLGDVFSTLGSMVNSPSRNFAPLNEEPSKPLDGDVAFANGTGWDPGDGRGLYYYDSGWVKL